jgi:very-short-patch-repair endonuclease
VHFLKCTAQILSYFRDMPHYEDRKPKRTSNREELLERRRENRQNMPLAEAIVWEGVRMRRLGAHFRRQPSILNFIVDLYCAEVGLIVEIDGATHSTPDEISYDQYRQRKLEALGYTVIRFTNAEVIQTQDIVLEAIRAKVAELRELKKR